MIWVALVFVVIAAITAVVRRMLKKDNEDTLGASIVIGVALVAFVVSMFFAVTTKIDQKHYGIEVGYGGAATGRETGAGLAWHLPWNHFDEWDATRNSFNTLGASCEKPGNGDLWVTIAGQGNACIRVQIEWQATNKAKASDNWSAYKPVDDKTRFEVFYERRVRPQMVDAVAATFRTFNPMTAVNKTTGEAEAPDIDKYKAPLIAALNERVGTGAPGGADVEIVSVSFAPVGYDGPTSQSIAAYGQRVREGRTLAVDETNAETRKRIAGDSGLTPFQSACLAQIKESGKGEPGFCDSADGKVTVTRANTPSE